MDLGIWCARDPQIPTTRYLEANVTAYAALRTVVTLEANSASSHITFPSRCQCTSRMHAGDFTSLADSVGRSAMALY